MLSRSLEDMTKLGEWVIQSQMELDGSIVYIAQHLVDGYAYETIGWFKSVEDAKKAVNERLSSNEF